MNSAENLNHPGHLMSWTAAAEFSDQRS